MFLHAEYESFINKHKEMDKIPKLFILLTLLANMSLVQAQQLDPEVIELINKGLQKNQKIKEQNVSIQQTKIDQNIAKSTFLPKLTFNGSFVRLNDDIRFDDNTLKLLTATQKLLIKEAVGVPFNVPLPANVPLAENPNLQNQNILKSSLDLDWVLFSGLKVTNALKATQHKEASLGFVKEAIKDKVALKIIEIYDQLGLLNASEKVLKTSEKYLKEQEMYVNKAIQTGLTTPISRKKIEIAKQQLKSKKLEFQNNKELLIEMLHQLTGTNKEQLQLLNPSPSLILVELDSESKKRNEIKALEEAEKATVFKSKMSKSTYIPQVALKGHYEFLERDLSLLDPKWYVGIGVKWNIFDGGKSFLESKKAVLEGEKYRTQIDNTKDMLNINIIQSQMKYKASMQNIQSIQKEVELAQETYDLVKKQSENGLSVVTDVLDALNDLEKANFKLQESYFNQRRAVINLLYAKGDLNY